ncbi:MAG TPA: hemolysin family protein [Capsulimonadaceae bacterium]|jgi:CBS domain containing-hemolysin-like protein
MNEYVSLVIAALLIAVSAFFVAAEYAIIRVRRTRVAELVAQGASGSKAIQQALDRLDLYLSGTQLGVTMTGLGLGWIGEPATAKLLGPVFQLLPIGSEHIKELLATVVGFAVITFISVIFGELLPKWTAIQFAERTAQSVAMPMLLFIRLFYPLIWALEASASRFAKWMGLNPGAVGSHDTAHSEDEIMAIVEAAERSGTIGQSEAEIVDNVFEFAHTQAKKIMVPRVNMVTLSTTYTIGKNVEVAIENGFTRYPLVEGDADHVIGMIHIKDLLAIAGDPNGSIVSICRTIPKVPANKPIDELLKELQKTHGHQAIVMDEYGGTSGLVTLEDILEELVGDIQDEFDRPAAIQQVSENEWLVASSVPISEIESDFGVEFPEEPDFETIGGYAMHKLGVTPLTIDAVKLDGFDVTVAETKANRVNRFRFVKRQPDPSAEGPAALEATE